MSRHSLLAVVVLACAAAFIRMTGAQGRDPGLDRERPVLALRVADREVESLPGPDSDLWSGAAQNPLHASRTPALYAGGPMDDGFRPDVTVRVLRSDRRAWFRIRWEDETEDRSGKGASVPAGGASHIHRTHTDRTGVFTDAACAMVPVKRGVASSYPSLMMGHEDAPVEIYCFRAGQGFTVSDATGRGTTRIRETIEGAYARTQTGWSVVLAVPRLTSHTAVAFAIWDGARLHRDGLKFFTPWYEVP